MRQGDQGSCSAECRRCLVIWHWHFICVTLVWFVFVFVFVFDFETWNLFFHFWSDTKKTTFLCWPHCTAGLGAAAGAHFWPKSGPEAEKRPPECPNVHLLENLCVSVSVTRSQDFLQRHLSMYIVYGPYAEGRSHFISTRSLKALWALTSWLPFGLTFWCVLPKI